MANGLFGDPVSKALNFTLNGLSRRQNTIANNIANVDTPGFKTSSVPFEAQLKAAMSGTRPNALLVTHAQHMQIDGVSLGDPQVVTGRNQNTRIDGSNVDVEREMFQLADTTIRYQTIARAVSERMGWLRTVINEGRR